MPPKKLSSKTLLLVNAGGNTRSVVFSAKKGKVREFATFNPTFTFIQEKMSIRPKGIFQGHPSAMFIKIGF
jgi:hypothetical protein